MAVRDVIGLAAVAERDVEEPIRPEAEGAAVVVGLGFVDAEDLAPAGRIDLVGIGGIDPPLGDHRLMVVRDSRRHHVDEIRRAVDRLGRVGVDQGMMREIGMGRQAEQTALVVVAKGHQAAAHIQQRRRQLVGPIGHDPRQAHLIVDEHAFAAVVRHGQTQRRVRPSTIGCSSMVMSPLTMCSGMGSAMGAVFTVTVTAAEVVVAPALSVATAVRGCVPGYRVTVLV